GVGSLLADGEYRAGEREGFARTHRRRDQKTLRLVAAQLLEHVKGVHRLDSLGDDSNAETMCHSDDGRHERGALSRFAEILDESRIDFEAVDRQLLQIAQRRVSRAEVIERNVQSEPPQLPQSS